MLEPIQNNTAPPAGAAKLIGLTSTSVYSTLVEATASKHRFIDDEITIMSELVAIELAMYFMDAGDVFGDLLKDYQKTIRESQNQFGIARGEARESYRQALASIERLDFIRSEAAANATNRFASTLVRN